jgi:hypothetical protein
LAWRNSQPFFIFYLDCHHRAPHAQVSVCYRLRRDAAGVFLFGHRLRDPRRLRDDSFVAQLLVRGTRHPLGPRCRTNFNKEAKKVLNFFSNVKIGHAVKPQARLQGGGLEDAYLYFGLYKMTRDISQIAANGAAVARPDLTAVGVDVD